MSLEITAIEYGLLRDRIHLVADCDDLVAVDAWWAEVSEGDRVWSNIFRGHGYEVGDVFNLSEFARAHHVHGVHFFQPDWSDY